jgi:hypothetical protein
MPALLDVGERMFAHHRIHLFFGIVHLLFRQSAQVLRVVSIGSFTGSLK